MISGLDVMAEVMTEVDLEQMAEASLRSAGWTVYHTFNSRRSEPGFPDIVAIRGLRLIYRECKTQKGKLTYDQKRWKLALEIAGADYAVWRPLDWLDGSIQKEAA